jgi:hypothetical protein
MGADAIMAGVKTLPYSLGSSLTSVVSGFVVARLGDYRQVIWVGWVAICGHSRRELRSDSAAYQVLSVLGWGLMTLLDDTSGL